MGWRRSPSGATLPVATPRLSYFASADTMEEWEPAYLGSVAGTTRPFQSPRRAARKRNLLWYASARTIEERLARFVQHKLLQFLHHEYSELLILSLSKSGHYLILQALSLLKSGNHSCERPESPDRQSLPENPKNKPIASVGAIEEWELS